MILKILFSLPSMNIYTISLTSLYLSWLSPVFPLLIILAYYGPFFIIFIATNNVIRSFFTIIDRNIQTYQESMLFNLKSMAYI
jgi:hypothetical protein